MSRTRTAVLAIALASATLTATVDLAEAGAWWNNYWNNPELAPRIPPPANVYRETRPWDRHNYAGPGDRPRPSIFGYMSDYGIPRCMFWDFRLQRDVWICGVNP